MANKNPKMSEPALLVYKSILDHFEVIKKQQWTTTNYAALIYAAIVWVGHNVQRGPLLSCALGALGIGVGVIAIGLLISFQYDLGELRKRATAAEDKVLSNEERQTLGLEPYEHPYLRGWNVLAALIMVCLFGAGLVVASVALGPSARH